MATKKDLEARIDALEAEIVQLRLRVERVPQPYYPYPRDWYRPTVVWCGAHTSPAVRVTIR